ncbi:MAG: YidC/Oxa1 family membrane protein insertase [Acidaminococcaceae bacterium]|nr:YidC/Oxa1 family membrane protein insertase [Acidaminococcaceae bacterium]
MHSFLYILESVYSFLYFEAYNITGNYGNALILLSFFSFIILFPFNRKALQIQNKEWKIKSIIAPQIEKIKINYKGQEQYKKLQRLYHRYSYHPLYSIRSVLGVVIQIPFLSAAYYMLSGLQEIKGVSWGIITDLGVPDQLLGTINVLPFIMTFVTAIYAFVMPKLNRKEQIQTIVIGIIFLMLLYSAPSALLIFWTCNLLWSLLYCILREKLQGVSEFFEENEIAFHIIFTLVITVGMLVPLEIYIKNASQLWFGLKDLLKFVIEDTVKYGVTLIIIYIVCWYKKVRCIYLSLALGVLFGIFLQSYIIGINYGLFDGHQIKWSDYSFQGVLNTTIWLFCLFGVFAHFNRIKFDYSHIRRIVKPVLFCIILTQCIVLLYNFSKYPLPKKAFQRNESMKVLTTEDIFTISSRKNIVIFLLDAFDASFFEKILVEEPQIVEQLKDFTFYPDTTSLYGYTEYSLPQILTSKIYRNDMPFTQYLEDAWKDNIYYKQLVEKGFDIKMYTYGGYFSKEAPVNNLITERIKINSDTMKSFKDLVLFRMSPHYAKKMFYDYDPNAWKKLLADKNKKVYEADDGQFYSDLKKGLEYIDDKNCFRFYYLIGSHFPFKYDRDLNLLKQYNGTQYEQSIGVIKIVIEYINQMKRKGVFDNSIFAVIADHGHEHNKVFNRPIFLLKQPNATNSSIRISNESISFTNFMDMLLQSFEDERVGRRFSLNKRYFYFIDEEKGFVEYQIVGNAKDEESWQKKKIFAKYSGDHNNSYNLGRDINFTMFGESTNFKKTGWSEREETHGTWSIGSDAELSFKINDYKKQDLRVNFTAFSFLADLPYRTAKIYINKQYVTDLIFDNRKSYYSFKIPASLMDDNLLNIHFTIDNSDRAINYENNEKRHLGIFMKRLKIEAAN